jgi:hypothetical protein
MKTYQNSYVSLYKKVEYVKLKKDYIPELEDLVNLIVIGGR